MGDRQILFLYLLLVYKTAFKSIKITHVNCMFNSVILKIITLICLFQELEKILAHTFFRVDPQRSCDDNQQLVFFKPTMITVIIYHHSLRCERSPTCLNT